MPSLQSSVTTTKPLIYTDASSFWKVIKFNKFPFQFFWEKLGKGRGLSFGQTQGPNPWGLTVYTWYCVIRVLPHCFGHLLSSPLPRMRQSSPGGCSEAPSSWLVPECWGAGRHQYFGLASEVCEWPGGCLGWLQSWAREKQRWWEQPCIVQNMSKI